MPRIVTPGLASHVPEPSCMGYGICTARPMLMGFVPVCSIEPAGTPTPRFRCARSGPAPLSRTMAVTAASPIPEEAASKLPPIRVAWFIDWRVQFSMATSVVAMETTNRPLRIEVP